MPKLEGIEEKYINGIQCHKESDSCFFNDDTHTYYDKEDMSTYVSVTTLIHNYQEPFNEEFWSAYKALEELLDFELWLTVKPKLLASKKFKLDLLKEFNIDEEKFFAEQNLIKAEYERKRNEACERGTKIHAEFENSFYNTKKFDFKKFGFGEVVDNGRFTCKKDYYRLDLPSSVYPEFLISVKSSDGELKVAGQIDCLIVDEGDAYIVDFKSNKSIDRHSYYDKTTKKRQMLKYPLNTLEDCNFNSYSLQLSTYAYMLETLKPELNIKKLILYHIDHDNKETLYECPYLKKEVIKMLNHYKKQQKIQKELDKDKPIIG